MRVASAAMSPLPSHFLGAMSPMRALASSSKSWLKNVVCGWELELGLERNIKEHKKSKAKGRIKKGN